MRAAHIPLGLLVGAALMVDAGCASSGTQNAYAPETMSLVLGQTGLVGGQQQGISIAADGRVTAWSGRSVGQNPEDRGFISESQGDSIWVWIQELDFWRQAAQPRLGAGGSAQRFISVTVADSTRRAAWPVGPGAPEPAGAGPELHARVTALLEPQ